MSDKIVLGISGSTRLNGNTEYMLNAALEVCQGDGLQTRLITLADKRIEDCKVCRHCRRVPGECAQKDDVPAIYAAMKEATAIIFASPVYFGSITGKMKCLIDRMTLSGTEGRVFERKIGGGMVVARRGGLNFTLHQLNSFFLHQGMVVPGSTYWNIAFGGEPGEVSRDEEGLRTVRKFASNITWLVNSLYKD